MTDTFSSLHPTRGGEAAHYGADIAIGDSHSQDISARDDIAAQGRSLKETCGHVSSDTESHS